jgi:hypothetical protein
MYRLIFAAGLLAVLLPTAPSLAVSSKDKAATCKFGADDQKLTGKVRSAFVAKCMSSKNDPRGVPTPGATSQPPK